MNGLEVFDDKVHVKTLNKQGNGFEYKLLSAKDIPVENALCCHTGDMHFHDVRVSQ